MSGRPGRLRDLGGADLAGADLYCAKLADANLSGAFLAEANLYYATMFSANFNGADLGLANLRRADLAKPIHPTPPGQTLLRVARQLQAITAEAAHELGTGPPAQRPVIPVAVNADSLSTWFLPALAAVEPSCVFDLHRSDQDQTAELLRDGTVMAAVTTQARPVPGCAVQRLGRMR